VSAGLKKLAVSARKAKNTANWVQLNENSYGWKDFVIEGGTGKWKLLHNGQVVAAGHYRSDMEREASALRKHQNQQQEQQSADTTVRTTGRFTTKIRSAVSGASRGRSGDPTPWSHYNPSSAASPSTAPRVVASDVCP